MTDTPEVEEQVEQQEEELWEDGLPSIDLICTKEYLNVNRIADYNHLMDEN